MNPKHIFIAEDDPASRELLREALEMWGHRVHAFENGAALLSNLHAAEASLFILDIQMPVLDGTATIARLRQEHRITSPILALTAFAMNSEKERILASGFDDYLTKPVSLRILRESLEKWLGNKGPEEP